jgi:ABC-type glycerol-3-phosphate transport system permease component
MAAASLVTIPVVAVYLLTQHWFERGFILTGFGGR